MKLIDIFEEESVDNDVNFLRDLGTFVAYSIDGRTATAVKNFCEDFNIPNPVEEDELHVSIIYSTTYDPEFVAYGIIEEPLKIRGFDLDIWKTQENKRALVAKFESEELTAIYNRLIREYDFENVYEEFKPHFTISYDLEGTEVDTKKMTLTFNEYVPSADLVEEYKEPLKQDWIDKLKKNKGDKKDG